MNFPYLPLLKFHSLTPLVYVFSSLSALQKPARSPLPSQKHTCYKVSPSQHRFTELDLSYSSLDILMLFLFTRSLKFSHSSLTPLLPLFMNSSFAYLFYLFSPALELPRRIVSYIYIYIYIHHWQQVHVYRFRARSTIHSSLSWTQAVDFHLTIEDRVGNVGLIGRHVLLVHSRFHHCHDSCFTSTRFLFADFTQCLYLAHHVAQVIFYLVTWVTMIAAAWAFEGEGSYMDGHSK